MGKDRGILKNHLHLISGGDREKTTRKGGGGGGGLCFWCRAESCIANSNDQKQKNCFRISLLLL